MNHACRSFAPAAAPTTLQTQGRTPEDPGWLVKLLGTRRSPHLSQNPLGRGSTGQLPPEDPRENPPDVGINVASTTQPLKHRLLRESVSAPDFRKLSHRYF